MRSNRCIDAGSEFCPCHLAELGECITCPRLRKEAMCACEWSGTCVYMEYQWSDKRAKTGRFTRKSPVLHKVYIRKNVFLLSLNVGPRMARELNRPGSFLFLRGDTENHFFDVPIAVIKADEAQGTVLMAVKVCGPKTKLLHHSPDWMYTRGPYWNGIFGQRFIHATRNSRCLVLLGGIPQASGALVANCMAANGNSVSVVFNAADVVFIEPYLNPCISVQKAVALSDEWFKLIGRIIEEKRVSCIYSGGNNQQHALVEKFIAKSEKIIHLSTSNNNRIHCGEGVCGSCIPCNGDHALRLCKAQK